MRSHERLCWPSNAGNHPSDLASSVPPEYSRCKGTIMLVEPRPTEVHTDRRTFMKVGAWSVPVIAVAAATPAAAASTTVPDVVISSDVLVLSAPTAQLVVCGNSSIINTSFTIQTANGAPFTSDATIRVAVLPPGESDPDADIIIRDTREEVGSFSGVDIKHWGGTLSTDPGYSGGKIGILYTSSSYDGGGPLALMAAQDTEAPEQVSKIWVFDIEEQAPVYEISNREYRWTQADGAWYLSGSLDLGQPACGPGYSSDPIDVLVTGPNTSWVEQTGSGDNSLHLEFQYPFGLGGPGNGMYLTFEIGEWSSGQLPFYYPAP